MKFYRNFADELSHKYPLLREGRVTHRNFMKTSMNNAIDIRHSTFDIRRDFACFRAFSKGKNSALRALGALGALRALLFFGRLRDDFIVRIFAHARKEEGEAAENERPGERVNCKV